MKSVWKNTYPSHMRIVGSFNSAVLALALPLLLAACGGGAGAGIESNQSSGSSSSPDTTSPVVTITAPTTGSSYTTTSANITVTSTATDNVGLSQITWSNNMGGSGSLSASGTSASGSVNVALLSGANVITVIARDTSGNTGQKQLTVNYTPLASTPTPSPSGAGTATIQWWVTPTLVDGVTCGDTIQEYKIKYGSRSGVYTNIVRLGANQPSCQTISQTSSCGPIKACSYSIGQIPSGTWYFTVSIVDMSGNESADSNEGSKTIP
jgi:hypothetical protein